MAEFLIRAVGADAALIKAGTLTTGMAGAAVCFEFSEDWADLRRTAVFRCGSVTKDVAGIGTSAVIPAEVLRQAGKTLYAGIYGVDSSGTVVIPTRWVALGHVYAGTDPSGDYTTDGTLPVWAQLLAQQGTLDQLETETKESLVAAVNEVLTKGGASETQVRALVEQYLAAHPEVELNAPDYVRAAAEAVAEKLLSVTGEASAETSAGSYTNQLPISTDTDGSVYNGVGYQAGYRLNSSGVVKEITESYFDAAVCTTGFIPCAVGDTIRIRGMVIDPADEQASAYNIHVYDAGRATVGYAAWNTLENHAVIETDADGYITAITLAEGTTMGNTETAYLRLCAKNITAGSIITINEEITAGGAVTVDASAVPFRLAFLTDLHWRDSDAGRCRAAAQALAVMAETADVDLVCFGGDYISNWSETTAADALAQISACRRTFARMPAPALWLRGNHENNGYQGQRLSRGEIFSRVSRANHTLPGFVSNPDDPYGCYGYLDFDNARVRVIAVNTGDNDEMGTTETASGSTAELITCHNIGAVQLQWLADRALDLSGKEEPGVWSVLVLSHIPIYSTDTWYNSHVYVDGDGCTWSCNVQNLETLMAAWRDGGSFSVTHNGITAAADFSGSTPAGHILFVNGHGHALSQTEHDGFVYITCPNLCNNGEKSSDDGVTYTKTAAGTAGETAFTVLTLDSANSRADAWIYGAGYDREIIF